MTYRQWWIVLSLTFFLHIETALLDKLPTRNYEISLKHLLEGGFKTSTSWLACQERRSWVKIDFARTVDNEEVETHPSWRHFETVSCVQEDATCTGVDSESYQSTCKTQMAYQPAMVRRIGSSDDYEIKQIVLPGMCSCWIDDDQDLVYHSIE